MAYPHREATPMREQRYRVVNTYGAGCMLKGGESTTTDEAHAIRSKVWWDAQCPSHGPHRVVPC